MLSAVMSSFHIIAHISLFVPQSVMKVNVQRAIMLSKACLYLSHVHTCYPRSKASPLVKGGDPTRGHACTVTHLTLQSEEATVCNTVS